MYELIISKNILRFSRGCLGGPGWLRNPFSARDGPQFLPDPSLSLFPCHFASNQIRRVITSQIGLTRNIYHMTLMRLCILIALLGLIQTHSPFIETDQIYETTSEMELSLILNQNKNTPIFIVQYSQHRLKKTIKQTLSATFQEESNAAFALLVDCRKFKNQTQHGLGICKGYDESMGQGDDDERGGDPMFNLIFLTPNPSRIKEKGHLIIKAHDVEKLQEVGSAFKTESLVKTLRRSIVDLINYVEDFQDLQSILFDQSGFRTSKQPKLIFYDSNLLASLSMKKLAAKLDGRASLIITDLPEIARQYGISDDDSNFALLEYDFQLNNYVTSLHGIEASQLYQEVLGLDCILKYLQIRKARDILIDFEHKNSLIYNFTQRMELNQLMTHGRIIVLQISGSKKCQKLAAHAEKYQLLFNYVCLLNSSILSQNLQDQMLIIDDSIQNAVVINKDHPNLYEILPKSPPRQMVSTSSEAQLCLRQALTSKRMSVFYYYNEKTHKKNLQIIQYFNSLPEVTSFLFFCQVYLPDQDVVKSIKLVENTLFSMNYQNISNKKFEHKNLRNFQETKIFLRELTLNKMTEIYKERLLKNEILQITSPEMLTEKCFNEKCIIGLLQTKTFHAEKQREILRQAKMNFGEEGFQFYYVDGLCHWQIAKQIKVSIKDKKIDRSYLFLYTEKNNKFALWKGNQNKPLWVNKDLYRWLKSLKNSANISRLKYGLDLEAKECPKVEASAKGKPVGQHQAIKSKVKKISGQRSAEL